MERERWEREVADHYARVLRGLIALAGQRERTEDALHDALVASRPDGALVRCESDMIPLAYAGQMLGYHFVRAIGAKERRD